ncbi:MAG: hypothetical protein Q7S19_00250 [bacterium]|nr:hypothetical protein [bacterium]
MSLGQKVWELLYIMIYLLFCLVLVGEVFHNKDTRSPAEQMDEARERARKGHQTMLNGETVRSLKPGDVVRYNDKLWIVRFNSFRGLRISHLEYDFDDLNPSNSWQMEKGKIEAYHQGTPEWTKACENLVLDISMPTDGVVGQPTAETSSHL